MELENYLNDLTNPDPNIRASTIIALGKAGDREAAKHLIGILENQNEIEWLRGCAAIALSRIPGEESVPPLIKAMQDESLLVSRAAILALGDRKCRPAIPYLEWILKGGSKKELQATAVKVLGIIGGREVAPVLLQTLENPDNCVKRNAAMALGEMHDGNAVIPLMDLLSAHDESLRAIAASSLGLIGDKRAAAPLIKALNDNSETVRIIAASSLGYLGDSKAVSSLEKSLQDESKTVRETAGAALLKLKSHDNGKRGIIMSDPKSELATLVSPQNVLDTPEILESYSRDQSFARGLKPAFVIRPGNVGEVQKIVKWANQTNTPLVPVSSGPPHFNGDTLAAVPGEVILDLSRMNKIIKINRRNRIAVIEPGVTYSELQPALAREGLRLSTSLLPRANKSVIASLLEREPRLNSRYQWSSLDPLRCVEIVWGDGNRLWSGSAGMDVMDLEAQMSQTKMPMDPTGPGATDFYRFLTAAQGSIGIATWASLRCEVLPNPHKLFFVPADNLADLLDFTYQILKFRYADELFLMNNVNLAYVLGENPDEVKVLKEKLPPWVVMVGIAGRTELPVERVEFQEKDIREIARRFNLGLKPEIPGAISQKTLELIMKPSREPYWKLSYKGACQDIFFITTLDKTPEFVKSMSSVSETNGYPVSDIGVYIQPRHQGVNCHCEFNLPYNPETPEEVNHVRGLYARASDTMLNHGAFFSRPYGIWANMAFNRDPQSANLLKNIKNVFDPKGIMNPGKLCF